MKDLGELHYFSQSVLNRIFTSPVTHGLANLHIFKMCSISLDLSNVKQ